MQTTDRLSRATAKEPTPPTPDITPTTGADDNPGGPMEINRNGITYDIRVDRAECDRRLAHLLAALSRPLYGRPYVVAPRAPDRGAETQDIPSHGSAPANPSRPRYPVRVTVLNPRIGSFLPCGTGSGVDDAAARGRGPVQSASEGSPTIQFSEWEYSEAAKKRPPGDQTRGP